MAERAVVPEGLSTRLVDAWLATHQSPNTRAAYRIDLATFGRWCAQRHAVPLGADTATLAPFGRARHAAGDSDATLRRRWSSLSSFYEYAIRSGTLRSNPVEGVDRPPEVSGNPSATALLSTDAVHAYLVLAAALDPRLEALVSMLVRDGIKLGEALALDVGDVTGRPPHTSVTTRRNGKTRRVPLAEATARAVRRCAGKRTDQPLFVSDRPAGSARRLTRFGADHLIRQLSTGEDSRVTANQLRRYYITSRYEQGIDMDDLRDEAGLANTRSVARLIEKPQLSASRGSADRVPEDAQPRKPIVRSIPHGRRPRG